MGPQKNSPGAGADSTVMCKNIADGKEVSLRAEHFKHWKVNLFLNDGIDCIEYLQKLPGYVWDLGEFVVIFGEDILREKMYKSWFGEMISGQLG